MMRSVATLCAIFVAAFVLAAAPARAQEFNCSVSVNYQGLQGNDFSFLNELGSRLQEYVNKNAWTNDRFLDFERINCTMQITFEEALSLTSFRARIIVAMTRPVYGTTISSTVFQLNDANWQFNYSQGGSIIFDPEAYDPLTSVIDFYAYLLLGYDYDTFSELGGSPFFDKARRVAEIARSKNGPGWAQTGTERGRGKLIQEITDPRFQPLRRAYFSYHLEGLDLFLTDQQRARQNVMTALQNLQKLNTDVGGNQFVIELFFSAKAKELAAIFDDSSLSGDAYQILRDVDPSNLREYDKLVQ